MKWKMNVPEMVAYRSFRPFYPLMAENQPMSVQLWAVWALHHVCCNKGKQKSNLKSIATRGSQKVSTTFGTQILVWYIFQNYQNR